MSQTLDFGFYPGPIDIRSGPVTVSTLLGLDTPIARVTGDDAVDKHVTPNGGINFHGKHPRRPPKGPA